MLVKGATGDVVPVCVVHAYPEHVTIEPVVISSDHKGVNLTHFIVVIDGLYINISTAHMPDRRKVVMLAKY
jgi:hypothetical protein